MLLSGTEYGANTNYNSGYLVVRPFQLIIGFGRCGDVHLTSLEHLDTPTKFDIGLLGYLRIVHEMSAHIQIYVFLFNSINDNVSTKCLLSIT